ncbi:MAG TPA: PIG-L family deacetylase [Ktedonobacteraceae bacterium]|nr:PIG-L family deacetylase [Ktedonobacteraceae bacterium]
MNCGGTIARFTAQGREVQSLAVTQGDRGSDDPHMTPERLATLREQEQRKAAILGVPSMPG